MLPGEGQADDGDGENEGGRQVRQGYLPTGDDDPDQVEEQRETAFAFFLDHDFFAERGEGSQAQAN